MRDALLQQEVFKVCVPSLCRPTDQATDRNPQLASFDSSQIAGTIARASWQLKTNKTFSLSLQKQPKGNESIITRLDNRNRLIIDNVRTEKQNRQQGDDKVQQGDDKVRAPRSSHFTPSRAKAVTLARPRMIHATTFTVAYLLAFPG